MKVLRGRMGSLIGQGYSVELMHEDTRLSSCTGILDWATGMVLEGWYPILLFLSQNPLYHKAISLNCL